MQLFQKGQKVICTHPTGMWLGVFPGPKNGELVTISKYSDIHKSYVELVEYNFSNVGNDLPDCYAQSWFKPLADISELTEILNAQPAEI